MGEIKMKKTIIWLMIMSVLACVAFSGCASNSYAAEIYEEAKPVTEQINTNIIPQTIAVCGKDYQVEYDSYIVSEFTEEKIYILRVIGTEKCIMTFQFRLTARIY